MTKLPYRRNGDRTKRLISKAGAGKLENRLGHGRSKWTRSRCVALESGHHVVGPQNNTDHNFPEPPVTLGK